MNLKLEPARTEQLAELPAVFMDSAIYDRYFAGTQRLENALRWGVEKGELWLAVAEDGRTAGAMRVARGGFCGLYPYLNLIGVHPDFRGAGVGGFLIDSLEQMARDWGSRRVTLMVSDFNEGAIRFYRSRGYWELGLLKDASISGIGEHVMVKDL